MTAGTHNITLDPRGSYREHYVFNTTNPVAPMDLTGYEARAQVRDRPEGTNIYITVSEVPSADGYLILGGLTGTVDVFFSDTATARLAGVRRAAWDLFLENPNGEDVPKVLKGKVTVDPSVTDPSND
jgi:hypothetical protein